MQLEVRINLILHATENENKVLESIRRYFSYRTKKISD